MNGTSLFAPHATIANLWIALTDSTDSNYALLARCTGTPPTDVSTFAHGCLMIRSDSGTGSKAIYENVGSAAAPSWNLIGDITAAEITLAQGQVLVGNASGVAAAAKQYGAVAVKTNGTTPVNLFGTTNGFPGSLTGIEFISADDANGDITVAGTGGTIAVIAKGSQGAVKGSAIAATAFTSAGTLTVVSSASSNGVLIATFITG